MAKTKPKRPPDLLAVGSIVSIPEFFRDKSRWRIVTYEPALTLSGWSIFLDPVACPTCECFSRHQRFSLDISWLKQAVVYRLST